MKLYLNLKLFSLLPHGLQCNSKITVYPFQLQVVQIYSYLSNMKYEYFTYFTSFFINSRLMALKRMGIVNNYEVSINTYIHTYVVHELRNKTCFPCLHSLVKLRQTFGRIREQISENPRRSRGFHMLKNSHKFCHGFQQTMEPRTTCFIFFYKIIIFIVNKRERQYKKCTL